MGPTRGTATVVLGDVAGSTRLWQEHPDKMVAASRRLSSTLDGLVASHAGHRPREQGEGDNVVAVFPVAADAIAFALALDGALAEPAWPEGPGLSMRIGIHTGDVEWDEDTGYLGGTFNRCARLRDLGHGGMLLVSQATHEIVADTLSEDVRIDDLGMHVLRDLSRAEHVYLLRRADDERELPPLRSVSTQPNNLPTLATSFVGREQELATVEKLVRGSRLVTITGVGGAGKTRIALHVAAALAEEFADGTWLVELAPIADPDLIDAAAASALRVAQQAGMSIREAIVEHLADREALIVLDNCEHLIDVAAVFVDAVLAAAPRCRVIATSRELLGIGGEVAYGLQPLHLPGRDESPPPAELARYDGIRLFLERAQAGRPDFHLTSQVAPFVVEICQRLDGMPLALELAAARIRSFSPQQIAENLDQRFRLLTGGSRTALPRQQTLAAAIDWSYRLLTDHERLLFERLSVFRGGFTLEAASAVCVDDDLDELGVLELLPALVDKSLVTLDTTEHEARYRLLETIRQFAMDKLDESGTGNAFRGPHARCFRDLAVEAGRNIRGPDEVTWWRRIDTELDNLRQAMTWEMEAGDPALALEIAGAFWRFWWFKARWAEGISWLRRTVEAAGTGAPKHLRAQGLLGYGSLLEPTEEDAVDILWEAFGLYEELEAEGADRSVLLYGYAAALINISVEAQARGGSAQEMRELNQRALDIARRIDDPAGIAVALGNLAESAAEEGEVEEARRLFAEAIEASRALNSVQRLFDMNTQMGFFELASGSPAQAREAFANGVSGAESAGLAEQASVGRAYLAVCDGDLGEPGARERFAVELSAAFENPDVRSFGSLRQTLLVFRASLDAAAGDLERAGRTLGASQALQDGGMVVGWELRDRQDRALALVTDGLGEEAARAAVDEGTRCDEDAVVSLLTG